jgi:glyoxylase-like metal-dependent hydrolase (beta-lactamase superfamily II)
MSLLYDLPHGITCIDTLYERPQLACCYLLVEGGQAAILDTGTTLSVPQVMDALAAAGLGPDLVRYVIPTHVHLDHAGGAGALMRDCPNAQMVVHPRGARHLINPSRLIASSTVVYGEAGMRERFGEIVPVDEKRVILAEDGFRLSLAGRELEFIHVEGHALHHFTVYDGASGGIFTGDSFGMCYPQFETAKGPFVVPPTTPTQFDPAAWRVALDRMMDLDPQVAYLTHFNAVYDVASVDRQLRAGLAAWERIGAGLAEAENRHQALMDSIGDYLLEAATEHGCELPRSEMHALLAMDIELDAQGVGYYLERAQK